MCIGGEHTETQVWIGRQPIVVLTDPELIRSAGNKVINRSVSTHAEAQRLRSGLVTALMSYPLTTDMRINCCCPRLCVQPLFHILRGTQKELVETDLLFARQGFRLGAWVVPCACTMHTCSCSAANC